MNSIIITLLALLNFIHMHTSVFHSLHGQLEEVDERLLSKFSYLACGDVSPMQAVIGSIAAQEVVKVSHVTSFPDSVRHTCTCTYS